MMEGDSQAGYREPSDPEDLLGVISLEFANQCPE